MANASPTPQKAEQLKALASRAGALALALLMLLSACATRGQSLAGGYRNQPQAPVSAPEKRVSTPTAPPFQMVVVEADVVEPGAVSTRVVVVTRAEFQRVVQKLGGQLRVQGTPQETAQRLFQSMPEEDLLAEVSRGRVLSLVPLDDKGPLVPEAEAALRAKYLGWCEARGGGDCLGLFDDGPYLRADDRRTLALALAFGTVLDETREALGRELSPRVVLSSLVWAVGMYLALWLVPEPSTKAVAAAVSVLLLAWLGVDAVWGLVDGWASMAHRAHEATTFAELREAGEGFGRLIGTDAARALILAVATLSGRTLGDVAARVRSLPKYGLAQAQWEAQGFRVPVPEAVNQVVAVETVMASSDRALMVLTSPQGPLAGAMLSQNGAASAVVAPPGHSGAIAIRHRGGNQQVILANGQRWHLPRGKWLNDIPAEDRLGDELQAAANRLASEWGPHKLSNAEREVIEEVLKQGNHRSAAHLRGLARGRWVHARLKQEFGHLTWNPKGVDVVDPRPGGLRYEVLSGTAENFAVHGRRMATEFFRMIHF